MRSVTFLFFILLLLQTIVFAQAPASQQTPPVPIRSSQELPVVPSAYPAGIKINYIRTWEPDMPTSDPAAVISTSRTPGEVKQTTQYTDGLGRTLQTVTKSMSPDKKDIVAPMTYDAYGREKYKYQPYVSGTSDGLFKSNPFGEQATFMGNQYPGEQVYFNETMFEASPLNRVLKTMALGNSWAGSNRGVSQQYLVNTAAEEVRIWNIVLTPGSYPTSTATYAAGALYKSVVTDEEAHQIVEYKDKTGQVVLKKVQIDAAPGASHAGWLCTYYVYDDLSNLRFVISPKAVETLSGNSATDAAQYGKNNFTLDGIPNTIVPVKVPNAVLKTATTFEADGMNATLIPSEQLKNVKPLAPMTSSPKPTNPWWMKGW